MQISRIGFDQLVCAYAMLAFIALLHTETVARAEPISVTDVRSAWKRNEEQLRHGHVDWKESLFRPRGYLGLTKEKTPNPPEDKRFDNIGAFAWSDQKYRSEYTVYFWKFDKEKYEQTVFTNVSGGATGTREQQIVSGIPPQGRIYQKTALGDSDQYYVFGILLWMRPLATNAVGLAERSLEIVDGMSTVENKECFVLKYEQRGHQILLYVDKMSDHSIIRYEDHVRSQLRRMITLKYSGDKVGGLRALSGVQTVDFSTDQKLRLDSQIELTSMRLGDVATKEDEFELNFLPGSVVLNEAKNMDFLVEDNGTMSPIKRKTKPLAADDVNAVMPITLLYRRYIYASIPLVVMICVVVVMRFRNRGRLNNSRAV